ncbi:hypothetical protein [Couchioplanes caeruleus]|uniref:Uncharacterized protein n=2 Tax=Couchioplanes caeruleus TaxID=56438 RepID=A0A1K0FG55_9ACTN|nr:hypothetical protein [Couchioplanes caeruleus]OJF11781.1 hypothetical protein BG844_24300 [Couchioplanes caeruleus subsp. caeruleus]ROP31005.1 hypothetical protein EDD30_3890 [Couchioplanes caeruleus]
MRLCRLGTLITAAVLAALVAPTPSDAAPAPPRLNTVFDPITIAPQTEDETYTANLSGVLAQPELPARPHRIAYTIDVTEVADLVELQFGGFADDIVVARLTPTSPPAPCGAPCSTPSLWEDQQVVFREFRGERGHGAPLTLVPQAASAGVPQVDVGGDNNWGSAGLVVKGPQRPDLAASAPAVTLEPGGTTTIRIGLTNRGPGTLYAELFRNTQTLTWLTLPRGVTATMADARCCSPRAG